MISETEWALFLIGAGIVDESALPPCPDGIDQAQWVLLCVESERIDALKGLNTYVAANVGAWLPLMQAEAPWSVPLPDQWSELSTFQKLLVIKVRVRVRPLP